MSTRLQVVMDEEDVERYRRRAAMEGLNLSEWVRQTLERAVEQRPEDRRAARLRAIDKATKCGHPTDDIEDILGDIERGRDLR